MSARSWISLGGFYMTPGYATEYMHGYLAIGLYPDPLNPDEDEFINLTRVPLAKVLEMIDQQAVEDSKTLALFALARRYLPPNNP